MTEALKFAQKLGQGAAERKKAAEYYKNAGLGVATAQDGAERPIPHDFEIEDAVLGAALVAPSCLMQVGPLLTPKSFFSETNQRLFTVLTALFDEFGAEFDMRVVKDELKRRGWLGSGEGQVPVTKLFELGKTANPYLALTYAQRLKAYGVDRGLIQIGAGTVALGYDESIPAAQKLDFAQKQLDKLQAETEGNNPDYLQSQEETIETMFRLAVAGTEIDTQADQMDLKKLKDMKLFATGFKLIDGQDGIQDPLMIIQPATMTGVLLDTGAGKTALGLGWVLHNVKRGLNGVYVFPELNKEQMTYRLVQMLTGVQAWKQATKRMNQEERDKVLKAAELLYGLPGEFSLMHVPGKDADWIRKRIQKQKAILEAQGKTLDFIIVDYWQRIAYPSFMDPKDETSCLGYTANAFGNMANEFQAAVILFSQLKRPSQSTDQKYIVPELHMAKGASAFEQYCNQIIGGWREKTADNPGDPIPGRLFCLKSTFMDASWSIDVNFDGEFSMWY